MYSIEVRNKGVSYTIYNPYDEDFAVMDAKLELEINHSGTLTFSVPATHPNIGYIVPLATEIYVRDDGELIWIGRPIEITSDFDETRTVTCEGVLGYLIDSLVPPFDYTESNSKTVRSFLVAVLNNHNAAVKKTGYTNAGINKTFSLGSVTVTDSNNNIARSAEDYNTTMDIVNTRLLDPLGGIFKARWNADGSVRYIDYVGSVGDADQDIVFGENLLDLSKYVKTESLITALYPSGATNDADQKLTLAGYAPPSSVVVSGISKNKADAYIWSPSAVNQYGYIYGTSAWDDVTLQQNLYTKAAKFLKAASVMGTTIELSAVDLSRISVEYGRFQVGQMVNVVSIPHGVNAPYQITKMTLDLLDPAGSNLVLGGELKTFTFETTKASMDMELKVASEISDAVKTATDLITGGLGGHVVMKKNDEGQPEEILIMNTADINTATRLWRWNLGGLGYSRNGYGGPYGTAITMDGAIVADFITTGTLNANLIQAGTINANLIKAGVLSDVNGNTNLDLSTGMLNIKKGTINLGSGNFTVTDAGVLTAKSGTVGGWTISSVNLSAGTSGTNNYARLSPTSGIRLGTKFSVNTAGELTAQSGSIGPWDITSDSLQIVTTNYTSTIKKDAIWIGGGRNYAYLRAQSDNCMLSTGNDSGDTRLTLVENDVSIWRNSGGDWFTPFQITNSYCKLSDPSDNGRCEIRTESGGLTIITGRSTSSHSGNVYITSAGAAYYANEGGSSRKIKRDIKPVQREDLDPRRLYDVDVIQYKYREDYLSEDDENAGRDLVGFIVEDLEEIYPIAVQKDPEDPEESRNWTWSPVRILPAMLKLIQDQHTEIEAIKEELKKGRAS